MEKNIIAIHNLDDLTEQELTLIDGGSQETRALGREHGAAFRKAFDNASLLIAAFTWFMLG